LEQHSVFKYHINVFKIKIRLQGGQGKPNGLTLTLFFGEFDFLTS